MEQTKYLGVETLIYSSKLRLEPINGEYRIMNHGRIVLDHLPLALGAEILYTMQQLEQDIWDTAYWTGWNHAKEGKQNDDSL